MVTESEYIESSSKDKRTYRIGEHAGIPWGTFAPEIKGAEGIHAILDHVENLESHNPIVVPSASYKWLRNKRGVLNRTNDLGEEIGQQEVAALEENHPIIYRDPPELFNFKRSAKILRYYLKAKKEKRSKIETELRRGEVEQALGRLPKFIQAFIQANYGRLAEEIEGVQVPRSSKFGVHSSEEVWMNLEWSDYEGYYSELSADASGRSSTLVPPVPLLRKKLLNSLVTATCTSNAVMAEATEGSVSTDAHFHLYLNYDTLAGNGGEHGKYLLNVVQNEISSGDYAGIAVTIREPPKIETAGLLARTETFFQNLIDIGERAGIPVIAPRSEWLGALLTDDGLAAYSAMMNSGWEYNQERSGGPGLSDQYGKLVTYPDTRLLKVNPPDEEIDLREYIADGELADLGSLPMSPPGDLEQGQSLQQQLGTPQQFREEFSKPRKLNHVFEAQRLREQRETGEQAPARNHLRQSDVPYIDV